MDTKRVAIGLNSAIEALEAMKAIKADKTSYIHQRYTDDIQAFLMAMADLQRAIEAPKDTAK